MSKPKRYPRARSQVHARTLKAAGHNPRKPLPLVDRIGPFSPVVLSECMRHRSGGTDEQAAKALDLLNLAASGKVVRINGRVIARPAGAGLVTLEIPHSSGRAGK